MKTYIFILTLLLSSLMANKKPIIADIFTYKTTDKNITIDTIKKYDADFKKFNEFSLSTSKQWIKIKLKDVESGTYIIFCGYDDFDISSFSPKQDMKKFTLYGAKHISFVYDKNHDSIIYYLHLLPTDAKYPQYFQVKSEKDFYNSLDNIFIYLLLAGIVLGLIAMTAIYNGALYYFNHEKSFLYYSLMQIFMVGVLFFNTGMPYAISLYFLYHPSIYEYLSLFTAFFAILFTRSFLDTKIYLPRLDRVLQLFLLFFVLDMLYFPTPIILNYDLYFIATAYFIVVGYFRMRQGYKPARFFLVGWTALTLGVLIAEYFWKTTYFDTMLLGSTIEAIMLALALAYKIRELQAEKEKQKELMIHQSKLASMGEMIGNIAHQWRQPLTHLSYILMNIEELDAKKERSKKVEEANVQLEFMSQTINDFRDFYVPDKEKEHFSIAKETQNIIDLINFQDIKIVFNIEEDIEIFNYKNEYKQVLLNLLSNAKEALTQREIKEPQFEITIDKSCITIKDNAEGIKVKNLQKIFEPYFTTKEKSSGIGLYMSKMIVEKNMKGSLSVQNGENGAIFEIKF